MENFFDSQSLSLNHVQVIVRGLHEVARSDAVHDVEQVLIEEFYNACRNEVNGLADFKDLIKGDFDINEAPSILDTAALRHTFIRSCLLLAYADGTYSAAERNQIEQFATALAIDAATLAVLKDQVTEHLMRQIAGVHNVDALCDVAKELQ